MEQLQNRYLIRTRLHLTELGFESTRRAMKIEQSLMIENQALVVENQVEIVDYRMRPTNDSELVVDTRN